MTKADYKCPQCGGRLSNGNGVYTCEDCGLNVTEVLERVADRDGPLADVAEQMQEGLGK